MKKYYIFKTMELSDGVKKLAEKNEKYIQHAGECWIKFTTEDLGDGGEVNGKIVGSYFNGELNDYLFIICEPDNNQVSNKIVTFEEFLQLTKKD